MERAQTDVIGATAFQADEIADHIDNICRVEYASYCFLINLVHNFILFYNTNLSINHDIANKKSADGRKAIG